MEWLMRRIVNTNVGKHDGKLQSFERSEVIILLLLIRVDSLKEVSDWIEQEQKMAQQAQQHRPGLGK